MAKTKKPEETKVTQSASAGAGGVAVGGNVEKSVVVTGSGNTVTVYIGGEKREMRTGWFFGHRYGDLAAFTGRADEMKMLDEWLANEDETLLVLRALGGFGKSALTWQWFNNKVDKAKWQTAIWWSFYEKESGFESFLAETLNHLGVEVKASARLQLNDLLEAMRGTNILIVLDGFERLLRQYGRMDAALQSDDEDAEIDPSQRDCSSPLTETFLRGLSGAGMKSKVLMTTRLCPRALESADGVLLKGCREEPLAAFSPEDAVTYFHNEGVKATRAEVIEACAAYGYHPLSLSLLVGLINEDNERRGDIAAVKNLEIFEDVRARRHHVLERAYGSLAPERRDLLSKISCFRGSMEYTVLRKVFPSPDLDKALFDLRKRGLLQYTGETGRYDMHPIVRHYTYERLTAPDRTATHTHLRDYFANLSVFYEIPPGELLPLDYLPFWIELYYHIAMSGESDGATDLYYSTLWKPVYWVWGAYQTQIELLSALFSNTEDQLPKLTNKSSQAWVLSELGNAYSRIGKPQQAIIFTERQISLQREDIDERDNLSIGLLNLAARQIVIGDFCKAESNIQDEIALCQKIQDTYHEAFGHQELGRLLFYIGSWNKSKQELALAIKIWKSIPLENWDGMKVISPSNVVHISSLLLDAVYRAQRANLKARDSTHTSIKNQNEAISYARRTLKFAKKNAKETFPVIHSFIRIYWLLGTAYRANNELTLAEENLSKALDLCRQINMVEMEADILLDFARLRYAQGDFKEAQEKASEALVITERSGYVLQGADVNLFLAEMALTRPFGAPSPHLGRGESEHSEDGVRALARKYAEEAKRLAYCDGPPYYYKVAYEEAERMLERLQKT